MEQPYLKKTILLLEAFELCITPEDILVHPATAKKVAEVFDLNVYHVRCEALKFIKGRL